MEAFDSQTAVSYWASTVHHRPNYRKPKAAKIDINNDRDTSIYMYSDFELSEDSDVTLLTSNSELDDDLTSKLTITVALIIERK